MRWFLVVLVCVVAQAARAAEDAAVAADQAQINRHVDLPGRVLAGDIDAAVLMISCCWPCGAMASCRSAMRWSTGSAV